MQQFNRSLTREIEVGGERLALTLSKEGLSVRPVGGRRPPFAMTWEAWVCACVTGVAAPQPTGEHLQAALQAIRAGAAKTTESAHPPAEAAHETAPSSPTPSDHSLTETLSRLDHWLSAHRARFQHALLPGASAADCDALAATLGKPLPEDLRTWLTWHNGQNADVVGAFEQSWNLMSAHEIADAKKELDAQPHDGWHRGWIPFLDDDKGDYLCLDVESPTCPVRECWSGRSDHPVVAASLASWLADFVAALERDAYVEDPERGTLSRH